jgi:hypothetical protein
MQPARSLEAIISLRWSQQCGGLPAGPRPTPHTIADRSCLSVASLKCWRTFLTFDNRHVELQRTLLHASGDNRRAWTLNLVLGHHLPRIYNILIKDDDRWYSSFMLYNNSIFGDADCTTVNKLCSASGGIDWDSVVILVAMRNVASAFGRTSTVIEHKTDLESWTGTGCYIHYRPFSQDLYPSLSVLANFESISADICSRP